MVGRISEPSTVSSHISVILYHNTSNWNPCPSHVFLKCYALVLPQIWANYYNITYITIPKLNIAPAKMMVGRLSPFLLGFGHFSGANSLLNFWWVNINSSNYSPGSPNIAVAGKWGTRIEDVTFLLKHGGFSSQLC